MNTKSDRSFLLFHVPRNPELLAAVGEVALRHEHLNHALKMTVKSLAGVKPEDALAATRYASSRELRQRIRKLARKRLGEGAALIQLEAILARCEALTEERNALIHGVWAKYLDGEAYVHDWIREPAPIPTVEELRGLANELERQADTLNSQRLHGFLAEALRSKPASQNFAAEERAD